MDVEVPMEQVEAFCRKWHVREFALFGSVLRDDFRPDSDIDVLVTFEEGARHSLFDPPQTCPSPRIGGGWRA